MRCFKHILSYCHFMKDIDKLLCSFLLNNIYFAFFIHFICIYNIQTSIKFTTLMLTLISIYIHVLYSFSDKGYPAFLHLYGQQNSVTFLWPLDDLSDEESSIYFIKKPRGKNMHCTLHAFKNICIVFIKFHDFCYF